MKLTAAHLRQFGQTGLHLPPIVFGSCALGDLPRPIPDQTKTEIVCEWFRHVAPPLAIDTVGGAGRGPALTTVGRMLDRLEATRDEVVISSRLGWGRKSSPTPDLTTEQGIAADAKHDDQLRIGFDSMLECWAEDRRLLGSRHVPQLVSVHDPDRYLAAANSPTDRDRRFQDILDAYRALGDLKASGEVVGIGTAATDWQIVREIDAAVPLDWVMLTGSLTVMRHPPDVLEFVADLAERRIAVVNAGLFHTGFLVGGTSCDGRLLRPDSEPDRSLLAWRKAFVTLCDAHGVAPFHAGVQFGLSIPGVVAVVLNTSHPDRVEGLVDSVIDVVPDSLWASTKEEGLIAVDYPHLA